MSKGIFSHVSGTTYYQYSELTLHESFLRLLNYQFRLFNSWDTNMNYLPVFIVQLLVVFIICKFFEILLQNKLKTTNKNELYVFFKKNPFLLSRSKFIFSHYRLSILNNRFIYCRIIRIRYGSYILLQ